MPDFKNLKELENYLKENPEIILKENIGQVIEYECPICKEIENIEIISEDEGKCHKCSTKIKITLNIE